VRCPNEAQLSRGAHAEYKCVDSEDAPRLEEAAAAWGLALLHSDENTVSRRWRPLALRQSGPWCKRSTVRERGVAYGSLRVDSVRADGSGWAIHLWSELGRCAKCHGRQSGVMEIWTGTEKMMIIQTGTIAAMTRGNTIGPRNSRATFAMVLLPGQVIRPRCGADDSVAQVLELTAELLPARVSSPVKTCPAWRKNNSIKL
jgi:hypothetical protein